MNPLQIQLQQEKIIKLNSFVVHKLFFSKHFQIFFHVIINEIKIVTFQNIITHI